jgi:hypothetical protein
MLQHQTPEYYYDPFVFGVSNSKLVPVFINVTSPAIPTKGTQFFFFSDEDLNGKTIKGIALADATSLANSPFSGYNAATLDFAVVTLTIANEKGNVIINDLPISILGIANNVFVPGRGGKKFKTKFKMNLKNSFIRYNNNPVGSVYPAVLPFIFYY